MPRFEYQFDTRIDERGRLAKKRLRIVALFLLISAVTAGIIYWIIPKQEDKSTANVVQTESKEQDAGDGIVEKQTAGATVPAGAKSHSVESKTAGSVSDKNTDNSENENSEPAVPENIVNAAENTSDAKTAEPVKGKAWVGDPVNDVPAAAENKNNDSALDELKQLDEKNNWKELADKSIKLMMQENEGSPNYRIAAKYLLKSRNSQLVSNIGVPGISLIYTVRGGDSLSRIARRCKTTVSALMYYNRLSSGLIRIGRKFIVHPGPWEIEISKSSRLLKLYNCSGSSRVLFAVFEVGVGRFNSTPVGGFVISSRIKDPRWYASDGRVYEPGEAGNELGRYFLKLAATGNPDKPFAGYGIHGTPDESSVGKSLSHGCVRMRNADVELLYNLVPEKTPVTITD